MTLMRSFLTCLILSTVTAGYSQWNKAIYDLPVTVPPSPTSSELGKYGQWPVSLYTGIPQIDIPLFSAKAGTLEVPVSISYHASGIKIEEVPSWVGAGWSLNAGGVITRTVMGISDEDPFGYVNIPSRYKGSGLPGTFNVQDDLADLQVFQLVARQQYDTEPDVFYFNFNGNSGKFFLSENNAFRATTHNTLKVVKNPITSGTTNLEWEIRDANGVTYIFGENNYGVEHASIFSPEPSSAHNILGEVKSAWYLTKIISAEKSDTIFFNYVQKNESYYNKAQQSFRWPKQNHSFSGGNSSSHGYGYNSNVTGGVSVGSDLYSTTGFTQLNEIVWKQGKLKFIATTNRQDITGKSLNKIELYRADGTLTKYLQFFINNNTSRIFLDSIAVKSPQSTTIQSHTFTYNPGLPNRYSNAQDFWGYYNGASNTHLIPNEPIYDLFVDISNGPRPSANRNPSFQYMKAGSLSKITFPTGGYTEFEYESNSYSLIGDGYHSDTYPNSAAGGLRIKAIKSYTNQNEVADEKNYEYLKTLPYNGSNQTMSSGILLSKPTFYSISYQPYYAGTDELGRCLSVYTDVISSSPFNQAVLGLTKGSPIGYTDVTEYRKMGTGGKTQFMYSFLNDDFNDSYFHARYQTYGRPIAMPPTDKDYRRGLLLEQHEFEASNLNWPPVKSVINTYDYNDATSSSNFYNLKVLRLKKIGDSVVACSQIPTDFFYHFRPLAFAYGFYNIRSVWPQLIKTEEKILDPVTSSYLVTIKEMSYENPLHLNVTQIKEVTSKNDTLVRDLKYAHEMVALGLDANGFYQDMINKNMIGTQVWESIKKNGLALSSVRKNFKSNWFSDKSLIAPESIEASTYNNPSEVKLRYHSYNKAGNVITVSKDSDYKQTYVWDYQSSLPIAEVRNAAIDQIAYTSFEADGVGGWTLQNNSSIIGGGFSGKKSFSGTLTKVVPSGQYLISLWGLNSGTQLVNGMPGTLIRTSGNWVLKEWRVTNPGTITISADKCDEVRLLPVNAQMNTYTYDPLIGLTSQIDERNQMQTFVYDEVGRLLLIRDDEQNVLKKYCYKYADQTTSCSTFTNTAIQQTFTKACPAGSVGSQVNYFVPTGAYTSTFSQSAANSMAQEEVTTNGQAHANALGTCTQATVFARMEVIPNYEDLDVTYGQVTIKFYSDINCTTPYSVSNLPVTYRRTKSPCSSGSPVVSNFSVNATGTSFSLGGQIISEYTMLGCFNHTFEVTAGSGYSVRPTVILP